MSSDICVFSAVCEADAKWLPQYLKEIERLQLPFVMYLDRCSEETKKLVKEHPNCVETYEQNDPSIEFQENHKQRIFDKIPPVFLWAMAWDVDEVWEKDALNKLIDLPEADYLDAIWVNLWEDEKHLRINDGFGPRPRTKFLSLKREWKWTDPVTNGPNMFIDNRITEAKGEKIDLVCVHHGLMTEELRLEHKERWDRIYTKAIGRQPYKLWECALDKTITPQVIDNPYL